MLFRPSDAVLINLSTCDSGVTAPATRLMNVHSSRLSTNGFPSTVIIHNTGTTPASAVLAVSDARDALSLGSFATSVIPANGELVLPVSTIESEVGIFPPTDMLHYVITMGSFAGYLQHRVSNGVEKTRWINRACRRYLLASALSMKR